MKVQVILMFVLLVQQLEQSKACLMEFVEEPPEQLNCNPYRRTGEDSYEWKLRLSCEVMVSSSHSPIEFEIHWFQRTEDGIVIDHGRPGPAYYNKDDNRERSVFGSEWSGQEYSDDMSGDFWCQPILYSNITVPGSKVLTVDEPDEYSESLVCNVPQHIRQTRCILLSYPNNTVVPMYTSTAVLTTVSSTAITTTSEVPLITSSDVLTTSNSATLVTSSTTINSATLITSSTTSNSATLITSSTTSNSATLITSSNVPITSNSASSTITTASSIISPSMTLYHTSVSTFISSSVPIVSTTVSQYPSITLRASTQTTSSYAQTSAVGSQQSFTMSPSPMLEGTSQEIINNLLLPIAIGVGSGIVILVLSVIITTIAVIFCKKCKRKRRQSIQRGGLRTSTQKLLNNNSSLTRSFETNSTQFQTAYELASNPNSPNIQSPITNVAISSDPLDDSYVYCRQQRPPINHHYSTISDNFPSEEYATIPSQGTNNIVDSSTPSFSEYSYTQVIKSPTHVPHVPDNSRYNKLQHSLTSSTESYNKLNHSGQPVSTYNSLETSQERGPLYKTLVTEPQYHHIARAYPNENQPNKYLLLSSATTFKPAESHTGSSYDVLKL